MKVYLAGPIFQQTDQVCNDWRAFFKAIPDYEWLDPMSRDYRGKEDESVNQIVEGDKEDIQSSDVVIAKTNPTSAGTSMEILLSWQSNKPVIAICEGRVSPWVRYHSTVVKTEAEALAILRGITPPQ